MKDEETLKLYQETMDRLQGTWRENVSLLTQRHKMLMGMKSSQVAGLVLMLIEMGIIKGEE